MGEQRVGQNILFLFVVLCDLRAILGELGLDEVGRTARDRLFVAEDLFDDLRIGLRRQSAVLASEHALCLGGDHLVSLAADDVEHRLRADDLAGRGDERRIAEILAHVRHFGEHFFVLVECTERFELSYKVGEHAARDLVDERLDVRLERLVGEPTVLFEAIGDVDEVLVDVAEQLEVEPGVVLGALQGCDHRLGSGLRGAVAERGQCAVDDVDARLNRLEIGHAADAGGLVGVQMDGHFDDLLDALDELIRDVRNQDACHILDADDVRAHVLELFGELDEVLGRVNGAGRIADCCLADAIVHFAALHRLAHVARVVERVEDADDVDAVIDGLLDELLDDVVGVVLVAENVLPSQKHLQLGVGHRLAQLAQSLPRILVEEAQAGVERRAAPALNRIVTDLVELIGDGEHLVQSHTRSRLRLVSVSQNCFGNLNFCHDLYLVYYATPNTDSNTPAATALPMTPATLGPIACMSR